MKFKYKNKKGGAINHEQFNDLIEILQTQRIDFSHTNGQNVFEYYYGLEDKIKLFFSNQYSILGFRGIIFNVQLNSTNHNSIKLSYFSPGGSILYKNTTLDKLNYYPEQNTLVFIMDNSTRSNQNFITALSNITRTNLNPALNPGITLTNPEISQHIGTQYTNEPRNNSAARRNAVNVLRRRIERGRLQERLTRMGAIAQERAAAAGNEGAAPAPLARMTSAQARENRKRRFNNMKRIQEEAERRGAELKKLKSSGADKCPICTDYLEGESGEAIELPCGHSFHKDCIKGHFRTQNEHRNIIIAPNGSTYLGLPRPLPHTCPLCQRVYETNEIKLSGGKKQKKKSKKSKTTKSTKSKTTKSTKSKSTNSTKLKSTKSPKSKSTKSKKTKSIKK